MAGDKFSNLKAGYTFMMGHPGKKLLFMGQDFGQLHEWDEKVSLDWYLTDEDDHRELQNYVKDLLHLYKKYPSLYRQDNDWNGFQWINANDGDRSIFSFIRRDETGKKNLMFIINFTPVERPDYRVGVPKRGRYTLLLDSHGAYKAAEAPASHPQKRMRRTALLLLLSSSCIRNSHLPFLKIFLRNIILLGPKSTLKIYQIGYVLFSHVVVE